MKILITGICGFVGRAFAEELQRTIPGCTVLGVDNFSRPGSEVNRQRLHERGVQLWHGDVRQPSDLADLPTVDWVVDAAANPSVLAGVAGQVNCRQLLEHNLLGTINVLEYCRRAAGGFVLLSTSRVYSIPALTALPLKAQDAAFALDSTAELPSGCSAAGISETFSTQPPLSLYGTSKLASEFLALEYAATFGLPVYINRCGVLAGAGQFGKPDQGIFSFWIHSYRRQRPLKYIGFGGTGYQVRDCLHPRDVAALVVKQIQSGGQYTGRVINVSGGMANSLSLAQLSRWCAARFGTQEIKQEVPDRLFDVPWLILDSSRAMDLWGWQPTTPLAQILTEIADHAEAHPEWLKLSGAA